MGNKIDRFEKSELFCRCGKLFYYDSEHESDDRKKLLCLDCGDINYESKFAFKIINGVKRGILLEPLKIERVVYYDPDIKQYTDINTTVQLNSGRYPWVTFTCRNCGEVYRPENVNIYNYCPSCGIKIVK